MLKLKIKLTYTNTLTHTKLNFAKLINLVIKNTKNKNFKLCIHSNTLNHVKNQSCQKILNSKITLTHTVTVTHTKLKFIKNQSSQKLSKTKMSNFHSHILAKFNFAKILTPSITNLT